MDYMNWISVDDRLPEDDLPEDSEKLQIKVLVSSSGRNGVRTLTRQRWIMKFRPLEYSSWQWSRDAKNITHWMYLPVPPKA